MLQVEPHPEAMEIDEGNLSCEAVHSDELDAGISSEEENDAMEEAQ